MVTAAASVLAAPFCHDCAGGGQVNGLPCAGCDGSGRQRALIRLGGWRSAAQRLALAAAAPAGRLVGTVARWSSSLPGVGGAAAVSAGAAMVAHGVWHALPEAGVGLLVAGVFGLMADRHMARP